MDLTRLAVDAGQFINRAVQYTEETLGQAERTELDAGLETLFARIDSTKTRTELIINQTECLLQPNSRARLEERLYQHLDWSVQPRPRDLEVLGEVMVQAGLEVGSNSPYGVALLRCGETQKQLGETERKFVQSANIHFLSPLKSFTDGEYRVMQDERRLLLNKRLDLDAAKTRVRKAHEADREHRNLDSSPVEDDVLSNVSYMFGFLRVKWLKMWAQEISQAEMEQRICQSVFDRQSLITRRVVEGIDDIHSNHMRSLLDLVDSQASYYDQCHRLAQELHKQLISFPAMLCSNSRQAAGRQPVPVQQAADFNQDSWSPAEDSTATAPQNNNNNNNNDNNDNDNDDNNVHNNDVSEGRAVARARPDAGHVWSSNSIMQSGGGAAVSMATDHVAAEHQSDVQEAPTGSAET